MGIAIGANHASVVWRVSVTRRVRYGRFHCSCAVCIVQMYMYCNAWSIEEREREGGEKRERSRERTECWREGGRD